MKKISLSYCISSLVFVNCFAQLEPSYEEGFVTVSEGINIYYEKIGDGREKIIIPGGMYYSPIFKELATSDRTLLIYDQRGRGRSSSVTDSTHLGWRHEVDDIESIRKHFKFEAINIIGWSYLGAIAAIYANTFPESTNRIILIGPMPVKKFPYWNQYLQNQKSRKPLTYDDKVQLIQNIFEQTGDLETYIKEYYKLSHQLLLFDKSIMENFRNDFYNCTNERPDIMWGFTFPAVLSSFGDWNFSDQLIDLKAKVLIIQGTYDPVPMESAKEWNRIIPNSSLWMINDVGHMPFVEKSAEVLEGINEFLNK